MKNKIYKILGVVLTLAVLSGLLIAAMPASVSAATQSWSTLKGPQVTVGTSANVFDIAGDGKTIFLYTDGTVATSTGPHLYKSTDGGINWITSGLDSKSILANLNITMIKINPQSVNDLVVSDGTDLYRSTNGGQTFQPYTPPDITSGGVAINSIDIAQGVNGGSAYLVGAEDGVYLYDPDLGLWNKLDDADWGGLPAKAAAFSPNYSNDATVVALSVEDGGNVLLRTMVVSDPESSTWDTDVKDCTLKMANQPIVGTATTIGSIAFPSNYNWATSTNRVFVGIGDTDKANNENPATDVYRINGGPSTSTSYALGAGVNISSLAYTGTISSGTLVAGQYDDFVLYSTTNVTSNAPTWNTSINSPYGNNSNADLNMKVKFAPTTTTLYAGATGVGSDLATSTDYMSFAGIAFVSCSAYANVSMPSGALSGVGAPTEFQKLVDNGTGADNGGMQMVFKSTDSGATWQLVYNNLAFNNGPMGPLFTTPGYATDQTIYIQQTDVPGGNKYSNRIVKSSDGGATWATLSTPGNVYISSLAVIDANSYWIGSAAGIRNSTSSVTVNLDGTTPMIMIAIPGFFVTYTTTGEVYVSTDMGATFQRLGNLGQFNFGGPAPVHPAIATFDVPSKTVYCVDSGGNIVKWTVGTDSSWIIAMNSSNMDPDLQGLANIANINQGPGGVWYIRKPVGSDTSKPQMYRSVDPLNPNPDQYYGFAPVSATSKDALGGSISQIPWPAVVMDSATGNYTYYTSVSGPTSTNYYPSTWETFTDILITAPKTLSPADGSTVGTTLNIATGNYDAVDFSWSPVAYSGASYTAQIAYDKGFTSFATNPSSGLPTVFTTTGTVWSAVPLATGKTFFFRVKVSAPMPSKWSTAVSFNTQIASDVNQGINATDRISPTNGAVNIPLQPVITWGAVTGATYDFKIATDAAFTQVVDSQTGLTATAYSPSAPLKPSTNYFWEVRAVAGSNVGDWVVSAFTTGTGAAAPTGGAPSGGAPVITVQPPQITIAPPAVTVQPPAITVNPPAVTVQSGAPSTPGYIWVIIAIGAVLVIAVIVLIARTRRM